MRIQCERYDCDWNHGSTCRKGDEFALYCIKYHYDMFKERKKDSTIDYRYNTGLHRKET